MSGAKKGHAHVHFPQKIRDVKMYVILHKLRLHKVYGVAPISRLLKIIGLFCRIQSLLQGSFAKETYDFKEPTIRSHPIRNFIYITFT